MPLNLSLLETSKSRRKRMFRRSLRTKQKSLRTKALIQTRLVRQLVLRRRLTIHPRALNASSRVVKNQRMRPFARKDISRS
jgi:hypothetical protein